VDAGSEQTIDQLRDVIVRSRLWLSSPVDFNDPFELRVSVCSSGTVSTRRKRLDQLLKTNGVPHKKREKQLSALTAKGDPEWERRFQAAFERNCADTGICSFAGNPRSILLWSHYGHEHHGVCFQFEIARDPAVLFMAIPMEYSDEYPEIDWHNDSFAQVRRILFRKAKHWSYEGESRILMPGAARSYIEFHPSALTAVVLGCRIDREAKPTIWRLLDERVAAGHPDICVYEAEMHARRYHLRLKSAALNQGMLRP
jgi:hypothetical protein